MSETKNANLVCQIQQIQIGLLEEIECKRERG
jgi:hypothetical protein